MRIVKVQLTNRRAHFLGNYDHDALSEVLKYRLPGYEYTNAAKYNDWDGYTSVLSYGGSTGAGVFLALRSKLEEASKSRFYVIDKRSVPLFSGSKLGKNLKLRPYQSECVQAMIAASATGGLVLNATGSGKTAMAGDYLRQLRGNALFLVDELTLLKQAKEELAEWVGEEIGEIGDSIFNPKRITVGTIQTVHLHRNDPKYTGWTKSLSVMIIDEIHIQLNRRNFETVKAIQPLTIFGLTATLELKKKHVALRAYNLCGPVIFEYPLDQGVREGYLSKGVAIAVEVENNVAKAKYPYKANSWRLKRMFYRKSYREDYENLIVDGIERNDLIEQLAKHCYERGKYVIVLLERKAHIRAMSRRFRGIPHETVFGERAVLDRVQAKKDFERGELRLLVCSRVFKKGINLKKVDVIIDGAAMKSRNDAVQKYGRGVRLADGKIGLIYFDIADVGNRFELAARGRRLALKRIKVPTFKTPKSLGVEKILALAESKLRGTSEASEPPKQLLLELGAA